VGSLVATVPAGCPYQVVGGTNYYVCNGTWYQPYYGNNGLSRGPAALTKPQPRGNRPDQHQSALYESQRDVRPRTENGLRDLHLGERGHR
jgi:hypothetical protein